MTAEQQIENLKAKLNEELIGGTEATPEGIKQRLTAVERSLSRIDGDGELRQLLATIDPKELQQMKTDLYLLQETRIEEGKTRISALEQKMAGQAKIMWTIGSAAILAVVGAILNGVIQ